MKRLRIVADAAGNECPLSGLYVLSYDPDAAEGRGHVEATSDPGKALTFATAGEAWLFWRKASKLRPRRPDAKPNRPLTGYTVEIS